ncbi:MAG: hypothetical protein ACXU85_00830 [Xanthobacteraceae bacterium]
MHEQVKHLRLDMNSRAAAPQLAPRKVELEVGEADPKAFSRCKASIRLRW